MHRPSANDSCPPAAPLWRSLVGVFAAAKPKRQVAAGGSEHQISFLLGNAVAEFPFAPTTQYRSYSSIDPTRLFNGKPKATVSGVSSRLRLAVKRKANGIEPTALAAGLAPGSMAPSRPAASAVGSHFAKRKVCSVKSAHGKTFSPSEPPFFTVVPMFLSESIKKFVRVVSFMAPFHAFVRLMEFRWAGAVVRPSGNSTPPDKPPALTNVLSACISIFECRDTASVHAGFAPKAACTCPGSFLLISTLR